MPKHYAELVLYLGLCDNRGMREGCFDNDSKEEGRVRACLAAIKIVREDLLNVSPKWSPVKCAGNKIVRDELEARRLINYLKKEISGVEEKFELLDSMHGKLRFFRKVRIDGMACEDRGRLIEIINESGVGPITNPRDNPKGYFYDIEETYWERALKFK